MNNKYQHRGGVQSLISTPFNLQLFANNKLISLDRMKDFLDKSKSIFYMESDCSNEEEISGIVENQLIPKPVDLTYYAEKYIPNYQYITEIPQDNLDYLNSGLVASNMTGIFEGCRRLQSIPKLNIDTSQCTDMHRMFFDCQALTTIDLSNFDTSKVTTMVAMFRYCKALTTIDLSNFDTTNVTAMGYMFDNCLTLTSLNLSNWDTSNVTNDMDNMFGYCNSLEHIEGIIDMKSCISYDNMFYGCTKLTGVKIKNPPGDFESETLLYSYQYEIVS